LAAPSGPLTDDLEREMTHQLTDTAARELHEDRRRHLLELAAQYQRMSELKYDRHG
jgi:hypothetical protein